MNAMVSQVDGTEIVPTRAEFAARINALWRESCPYFLEMGKALREAKEKLKHGEFTAMIYEDFSFGPDTARRFMRLAGDGRTSNHATLHALPQSTVALDHLRKLPPERFERLVEAGVINPHMTERDAAALLPRTRDVMRVASRPAAALASQVTTYAEFLATVTGYRKAQGLSQLSVDDAGGLPDGYTGKLEIDMRRAIDPSFWNWLGALGLGMMLLPITNFVRLDICPCCRQPKGRPDNPEQP